MAVRVHVPTDGSTLSKKAVAGAIAQAAATGAELVVLYVVPPLSHRYFEGGSYLAGSETARRKTMG